MLGKNLSFMPLLRVRETLPQKQRHLRKVTFQAVQSHKKARQMQAQKVRLRIILLNQEILFGVFLNDMEQPFKQFKV